ncbi:MAG: hypothetical protein AMXMBFR23_21550 [Chloroflexota bacterium]
MHLLETADGHAVEARLWRVDPVRVAIYLHEYRETQATWWDYATVIRRIPVSAITFDFRGHTEEEGDARDDGDQDDIPGMVEDARAAVAFAREQGFEQIMLVGAGMGAAVAIEVAAGEPDLRVIGLSTPSEFDLLLTRESIVPVADRVALAATEEDLSAAHSLTELQEAGRIPAERVRLYPGRAHGVEMLTSAEDGTPTEARVWVDELLTGFWPGAAATPGSPLR